MSSQWSRLMRAALGLALVVPMGFVAHGVVQQAGWAAYQSQATVPEEGASTDGPPAVPTEDAQDYPLALYSLVSDVQAPCATLPEGFEREVFSVPDTCLDVASNGPVAAVVLALPLECATTVVRDALVQKGWHCVHDELVEVGQVQQCSFWKRTGRWRWVYATLYGAMDATTCVFTCVEEGEGQ